MAVALATSPQPAAPPPAVPPAIPPVAQTAEPTPAPLAVSAPTTSALPNGAPVHVVINTGAVTSSQGPAPQSNSSTPQSPGSPSDPEGLAGRARQLVEQSVLDATSLVATARRFTAAADQSGLLQVQKCTEDSTYLFALAELRKSQLGLNKLWTEYKLELDVAIRNDHNTLRNWSWDSSVRDRIEDGLSSEGLPTDQTDVDRADAHFQSVYYRVVDKAITGRIAELDEDIGTTVTSGTQDLDKSRSDLKRLQEKKMEIDKKTAEMRKLEDRVKAFEARRK